MARASTLLPPVAVDGSVISHSETAEMVLDVLRPNIYFKGQEYQGVSTRFSENFQKELTLAKKLNIDMCYTQEKVDSSTRIIEKIRFKV